MEKSRHALRAALLLAAMALPACATSTEKPPSAHVRKDLAAADYYPLQPGWKWAYDLEKDGQRILAVYSVLERTGETATVQAGDDRLTYAVTAEGIAQKEGAVLGDYIIKNPVAVGTGWLVGGGTAKLLSVSQEVTVPAGHFTDCVVVEVTRSDPVRIARTTFAPEVGPATLEFQIQQGGQFVTTTRASLRAVTKPGDDLFRSSSSEP